MNLNKKQRGMTGITMAFIVALLALVMYCAFKVYPNYYDDFAVSTALENMQEEGSKIAAMSPSEIRTTLDRRISTSGVSLKKDNVIIKREKGAVKIDVIYEVRTPLFGNIDAVTKFDHSITVSK